MECPECGRYAPPDPETGYDADDICSTACAEKAAQRAIEIDAEFVAAVVASDVAVCPTCFGLTEVVAVGRRPERCEMCDGEGYVIVKRCAYCSAETTRVESDYCSLTCAAIASLDR